jgi:adenylylsulfate kinase
MPELVHQNFRVNKKMRNHSNGHNSFLIWLTGLSGSGKSTIANELEFYLFSKGIKTFLLDGDNLRLGLNSGLGFSAEDRSENLRRVAEVAKLQIEAGLVTIAAFISPLTSQRERIRNIVGEDNFIEIYINTPLEICIQRDVKGLYQKAIAGEIKDFTGISAPYEVPKNPHLTINTAELNPLESAEKIIEFIQKKLQING